MGVWGEYMQVYLNETLANAHVQMVLATAWTAATVYFTGSFLWVVGAAVLGMAFVFRTNHPKPPGGLEHLDSRVPSGLEKPTEEKMCVIGAGFMGLAVAGGLRKKGIPFVVIEKECEVGGNWFSGVYESVHIISSKKTTEYLDYPMPQHYPDFPSYKQMGDYLLGYAAHFQLRPHLRVNTNVSSIKPLDGANGIGSQWAVETVTKDGVRETAVYKGVIVCTGHHWDCRMPSYPGQDSFKGEIIHSKQYMRAEQLAGKRVLVIGGGNSACDVVVESTRVAAATHLSVRRGYWYIPRSFFGTPLSETGRVWLPQFITVQFIKLLVYIAQGSPTAYGLPVPDHNPLDRHPTVNSSLLLSIQLGQTSPHPDIECFPGGNTVRFKDGKEYEIDIIVACTGYYMTIPVLGDMVEYKEGVPQLINNVLLPGYRNLYCLIGAQIPYGVGPVFTSTASYVAAMIQEQQRCQVNLVDIYKALGAKPCMKAKGCPDVILDPFEIFKTHNIGRGIMPHFHTWERTLFPEGKPKCS